MRAAIRCMRAVYAVLSFARNGSPHPDGTEEPQASLLRRELVSREQQDGAVEHDDLHVALVVLDA